MIPRGVRVSKAVKDYDKLLGEMTGQGMFARPKSISRHGVWKQETPTQAMKRFEHPTPKHPPYVK